MAISGLPNPDIHRKCKRCYEWFDHYQVDLCWPPKTGLVSYIHVTLSESADMVKEQKYYCRPCQELNAKAAKRFRSKSLQSIAIIVVLLIVVFLAWLLGAEEAIRQLLRSKN